MLLKTAFRLSQIPSQSKNVNKAKTKKKQKNLKKQKNFEAV